jgi:hypothetical protein
MWEAERENYANWCSAYTGWVLIIADDTPLETWKNAWLFRKNARRCLIKAKNAWLTNKQPRIKPNFSIKLFEITLGIKFPIFLNPSKEAIKSRSPKSATKRKHNSPYLKIKDKIEILIN